MTTARNLVVLRCGNESLHEGWMGSSRNWDLAVSYFGADDGRQFPGAAYCHRYKGGKWNGIYAFFEAHPELLQRYDYFWLPDDDIAASSEKINRIFEMMATHEFELVQPSLTSGSFLSHLITLNNSSFVYRRASFVELMVPVFSRAMLQKVLPLFEFTRSGFGMDYVWHRFTSNPLEKVAILDNVSVTHTRPVGGALHKMMRSENVSSAQQEQEIFLAPYGVTEKTELILGGLLRDGRQIRSRTLARLTAAIGWSLHPSGNCGFTERIGSWRFIRWVVRNLFGYLFKTVPLTRIEPLLPATANTQTPAPELDIEHRNAS
jgi:hypothetical protein